jgi:hypothetical protein
MELAVDPWKEERDKQTIFQQRRIYRTTRQMHVSDHTTSDEHILDR